MSRVYLARERSLDREVAIKVLLPELRNRREDRERFRREARVLASLRHPGIMPVHALGDADGIPYFVMPYVAGPCLARRLAEGPRFTQRGACALLVDLTDAVAEAHRHGVVHRDIKPENVLLENGHPILADFGVATLHTSDHSRSEVTRGFGTLASMSPEQLLGQSDSDERSDIYSLGVLAFQLVAGRTPFSGRTERELAAQHIATPAPRVSVFRPEVSRAFDDLIHRCLAKNPADRWQTAAALRDALRVICSDMGLAGPESAHARSGASPSAFRQVTRRHALGVLRLMARILPYAPAWISFASPSTKSVASSFMEAPVSPRSSH